MGPFGEAIVDPRFLESSHSKANSKITQSFAENLLSLESIVKQELSDINTTNPKPKEPLQNNRKKLTSWSDLDEGFYDRASVSPGFHEEKPQLKVFK